MAGDQLIKYLTVLSTVDGVPHLDTFLDEHFHEDWGSKMPRAWQDEGRYRVVEENQLITADTNKSGGAGFYEVMVGEKTFSCIRVLDSIWTARDDGVLVEAFLSREGRTVLLRRYNGKAWRPDSDWLKQAEANQRIILDGIEFIHWYDCISLYALEAGDAHTSAS